MRQYVKPGKNRERREQVTEAQDRNGNISIKDIKQEVEQLLTGPDSYRDEENKGLFLVRTADGWMEQSKKRPTPQMLFSEFWHEGELCILFADTNLGKSILAVQIGNSISRGEPVPGFVLQSPAQPILYFDFELSDKQFESRYSKEYTDHYPFHQNFYRAEINPDADIPEERGGFESYLNRSLEQSILDTGAKVLIIDNLTYLKTETEQARNALPLMKHLKSLKQRYELSILALAHTPKRDASKPISKNDLQGSKMLMNFCDSAFSIGESHTDKNLRYLKQIKQRYTEGIYDADNVVICQTIKPGNFLQFEFLHFGTEWEHLKRFTENEKQELEQKVKEILDADPDLPVFTIAKQLCTDESKFNSFRVKVSRIVNRIRNAA